MPGEALATEGDAMEGGEGEVGGGTETAMDDLVADRGTAISELFKHV